MTSPETNPAAASGQVLPAMLRYYRAQARSSSDETEIGRIARGGLTFNAPLSDARAAELLRSVRPFGHGLVADLGCGWAELLIRALEAEETATGVGVDSDADAIGRGRAAAADRGVAGRVQLEVADVTQWQFEPVDLLLCIGSSHAWAGTRPALGEMRPMLRPGGRLLFGEGFWERPPGPDARAALGSVPDGLGSLAELADLAVSVGYRVLALATASADEWDAYESGWLGGLERWLLHHPDSSLADRARAAADAQRRAWLHGRRGNLGFAYLTLAVA